MLGAYNNVLKCSCNLIGTKKTIENAYGKRSTDATVYFKDARRSGTRSTITGASNFR